MVFLDTRSCGSWAGVCLPPGGGGYCRFSSALQASRVLVIRLEYPRVGGGQCDGTTYLKLLNPNSRGQGLSMQEGGAFHPSKASAMS